MSSVYGFDIGGANVKFYDSDRDYAASIPFRLWKQPAKLADFLRANFSILNPSAQIAITMTAELCDCFESKREGVNSIANSVCQAFGSERVQFYAMSASGYRFCRANEVGEIWQHIAAANWHASATLMGRLFATTISDVRFLVDIGSTTTDIIPVRSGVPHASGHDDFGRIKAFELLYTGVARTPVFGVLPQCLIGENRLTLAPEWFATMHDVYLLLNEIPEDVENVATCDGRPATQSNASRRIARLLCLDDEPTIALEIAKQSAASQANLIRNALKHVVDRLGIDEPSFLIAGEGAWLARRVIQSIWSHAVILGVDERLGIAKSKSIGAVAVAELLQESLHELPR
jgi:(4-(4-[2-(gamma-L-glutamylamino)ethyl]phenoxymethyl)furan-2-yl)methanamine synthase